MNRGEKISLEIADSRRNDERRIGIKLFAWFFLGCAAIIVGLHYWGKYLVEHKPVPTVNCNKQTYNGHDYLFLAINTTGQKGVVHDPDCACRKSAENRQAKTQKTEGERYLIMPTVKETSTGVVSSISTR